MRESSHPGHPRDGGYEQVWCPTYSRLVLCRCRFLALRMPFCFAIRRCSLLETNHLFLRTSLRTRPLVTSLRKRLSKLSCDSPGLSFTLTFPIHPPSLIVSVQVPGTYMAALA